MSESSFPLIRKFVSELAEDGKGRRRLPILVLVLFVVLVMLGLGSCEGEDAKDGVLLSEEGMTLDAWRRQEEEKLATLLCRLDGVERCFVSINYVSGEQTTKEIGSTVGFEPPRVGAVVVLYDGVGSVKMKETLVGVVTTLYDIGSHRVSINLL